MFLLNSCSSSNDDLKHYIDQVKQRKSLALEPIPVFVSLPHFKFPADTTRRNPFQPFTQSKRLDSFAPDPNRVKHALEAYPLGALKFVGILTHEQQIWGLIKRPDEHISRVRIGDYLGKNNGRIILIKDSSVQLQELRKNDSGAWEKHFVTLELDMKTKE